MHHTLRILWRGKMNLNNGETIIIKRTGSRGMKGRIVDKDGNTIVKTKTTCHPDDEFNVRIGVKNIMFRLWQKMTPRFVVGQMVNLPLDRDVCRRYKKRADWFIDNNIDMNIATRFGYNAIPSMNRYANFGIIVAVAYDKKEKRFLYAVEIDVDNTIVLVDDSTLDITGITNKIYAC